MKISFEGTIEDIFNQMESMLTRYSNLTRELNEPVPEATVQEAIAPVDKPVEKPAAKPKERTTKQKENDERLRAAAKAKQAAKKTAKPAAPAPEEEEPKPFGEVEVNPADIVKLRQRTLEDLQTAYANGHHQEVLELLSRFGDGAKSFRELPPDAFVPIREAIDNGALA